MDEQRYGLLADISRGIIDRTKAGMSPMEEAGYQAWLQNTGLQETDDFNNRAAYLEGLRPDPNTGHFVDWFKLPNHPTYSDGSVYADELRRLFGVTPGTWGPNGYVPSVDNTYPLDYLRDFYFPRAEAPGTRLYTDPDPEAVEPLRQALDRQENPGDRWYDIYRAAGVFSH